LFLNYAWFKNLVLLLGVMIAISKDSKNRQFERQCTKHSNNFKEYSILVKAGVARFHQD